MSIRHQTRLYIEELFSKIRQESGKYPVYNLYLPKDCEDPEEINIVDMQVNFSDEESIKKYLDRTTRETLEAEVKGLKLVGIVLEKEGSYIFSSKEDLSDSFKKSVIEKIESIKEE
ncbi:hypothetical protein [Thermocrinis jamiesonii]|uniref:hypothetical protein n=1 Tax=Thermocrinis jamiesonii TaxID=1302351 RepID=UPI0004974C97|nr:hypothetical protein [Thermocrinis jamiesonii]